MEILVEDEADAALVTPKVDEPPVDEPPPAEGACGADASLGTAPPKAKRGRPVGSRNKVRIVEPLPAAGTFGEPDPELDPPPPPQKTEPHKKARTRRAPTVPQERSRIEAPIVDAGIQSAAAMLHLL